MKIEKDLILGLDENTEDPLDYKGSVKADKLRKLQAEQDVRRAISKAAANVGPITSVTELAPIDSYWEKGETLYDLQQGQQEYLAKQQGALSKVANTIGQGVGTFLTATMSSLATIPGALAALGAEAATLGEAKGMDIMLNNPIMQGISQLDKSIKQDLLPTYYTKEQQESLLSASTLTDGVNGLGFLLSNIIPGLAVTKGLGGISKVGSLAKLGKLEQTAERAVKMGLMKTDDASRLIGFGNVMKNIPPITGAIVGRLGESAMEANGIYEELIANGVDEEEAKRQRDNVFYGNMALAASDLSQFTRWFKPNPYELIVKEGAGYGIKKLTKKELIGGAIKEATQEAGEEGYQFILGQAAKADAKDEGDNFIGNFLASAGDAFTTVEGQKSMLLGAVLGAGAGTYFKARNAKELNTQLNDLVSNLNANPSLVTEKYIKNAEGKYILNPEFVKTNTIVSQLEATRNRAIEQGNPEEAELAEQLQLATIVNSRVQANKFDDLIEELEVLGQTDDIELEQYFGTIPTDKNGNKLSAKQVIDSKIAEAKRMKKLIDGIGLIPQFQNLTPQGKFLIAQNLLTQDALAKQIANVDSQISELSVPTYSVPVTTGTTTEAKEQPINPINAQRIADLEETKTELVKDYNNLNDVIKKFTEKPETVEKKVESQNEQSNKAFEKEIEKENEKVKQNQDVVDNAIKNKQEVVIQTPEGEVTTNVIGIDPETGEIITEAGLPITPEEILSQQEDTDEKPEDEAEYEPTFANISEGPKKISIYSTSTSAHETDGKGFKVPEFIGNPWNELKYQLKLVHAGIVKYMAEVKNTPSKTKRYTVKLGLQNPTQEILNLTNKTRKAKGLTPLTMEDFSKPEYRLITTSIYENGNLVSGDITHFHDIDFFEQTAEYERLEREGDIEGIRLAKEKFLANRIKIINELENGKQVELQVENKSNGVPNFNPLKDGKNQVSPIYEVFKNLLGSTKDKTPYRGLGVIYEVTEDSFEVRFENGQKQTYPIDAFATVPAQKGLPVFETVSANGTPYLLDAITFNEIPPADLQSLAKLVTYKLFSGNEITKGKDKFELTNANKTGILNTLLYLGPRTKREKQIFFKKDGTLVIGKKEFTIESNPDEVMDAVFNHLSVYNKYPKYPFGAIQSKVKIILPSEIDDQGNIVSNESIQTIEKYLFGTTEQQRNPLIGTNINSEIQFINSYFTYAVGPDGMLLTGNEQQAEPVKPFAEELSKETTPQTAPVSTDAKADTNKKSTKVISSEIVEKGNRKGQTRIVTQTNSVENVEGTLVSVTEYEAKVGDTTVTLGGRRMTFKEFKEEFPLDEDYEEILGDWPDLNDDTIITVTKVKRTSSNSKFKTVVSIYSPVFGDKMDISIKENDAKYNAELAALEGAKPVETKPEEVVNKAEQINKECDGVSGNTPTIKGTGGNIDPDDFFS